MSKAGIKYIGNHVKHPPSLAVLKVVTDIVNLFLVEISAISAVIAYDDDKNEYTITFAWEGVVFFTIKCNGGSTYCQYTTRCKPNLSVGINFVSRDLLGGECPSIHLKIALLKSLCHLIEGEENRIYCIKRRLWAMLDSKNSSL